MKTITLARAWRDPINDVTVEEYPAGWTGAVSNDRADRAKRADVLVAEKKPEADE
ncbi:MAG: hypothetical protein ACK4MI_03810 [Brevundimonas sp.]|uniref:hypothetical protein n=1 Tax=Brevundimonas sp. TaxID=1871086 RepID=UPI00391A938E